MNGLGILLVIFPLRLYFCGLLQGNIHILARALSEAKTSVFKGIKVGQDFGQEKTT